MSCALLALLAVCGRASSADAQEETPWWLSAKDRGTFSLRHDIGAQPFIVGGQPLCAPDGSTWATGAVDDRQFGPGELVELRDSQGHAVRFSRHEGLPFTLVRASLQNTQPQPSTTRAVDVLALPIDLGLPIDRLRVLGTGGLAAAGEARGSYMWIAVADPQSRRGVVIGWLSAERGSGVLLPEVVDGRLVIRARLEFGHLLLAPEEVESLEPLVVGYFDDARFGLEAYGRALGRFHEVRLKPPPCGYCTWYHAGASNEKRIVELAEFAKRELAAYGLEFLQIDDGWQDGESKNGPRKNFTTHRAKGPYPRGMASAAASIDGLSFTPGLWLMPFSGTWDDPFFGGDRQAWFAHREDGTPFDTNWGGTCFDLTREDVRHYVGENVERAVRSWGFRYLKLDGLWTGSACDIRYVNDAYIDDGMGNSIFSDPMKTNPQALRDGLRIVRRAAGDEVFLLGCCAPQNMRSYGGAFGLVDAMRIGPDNGANVEGLRVGPRYGSRNYFLNGRLWWNDPDPVYVRPQLSLAQAELSCSWAAIAGQLTVASDDFARLPPERLNVLRRVMPVHRGWARPVDLFDRDLPRVWTVGREEQSPPMLVGLFNWENEPVEIDEPLERLGLDPQQEYWVYEFWSGQFLPLVRGRLSYSLEPIGDDKSAIAEREGGQVRRCCAVLAIRPATPCPQVLSTSRHVTQGLVDLEDEIWDPEKRELRGTSRVVGGEPYELRIAVPGEVGKDFDSSPPINASLFRQTIDSTTSSKQRWSLKVDVAK